MEKVTVDEVEPDTFGEECHRRGLSDPLGTTDVALNHYRIAPGERFPGGVHAHADQEEVFVVLAGEATFETMHGEVSVGEREVIRFAPGEFQSGTNETDERLVVVALGAPRDSEDVRIPVECPACGHGNVRLEFGEAGSRFVCPDCHAEHVPDACPECGHDDLHVELVASGHTAVVCSGCGARFEDPPLRE